MKISFEIPDSLDQAIEAQLNGDAPRFAKEALVVELYRAAKITLGQAALMLGIAKCDVPGWLASRAVPLNYDLEDLELDRRNLDELFKGNPA